MTKPILKTLDGKEHEIRTLTGRDWRILGEFIEAAPEYVDVDFLEKHAEFVAKFFSDIAGEDILNLPLEEILPLSARIRKYIIEQLTAKLEKIEKNSEEDKTQ